MITYLNAYVWGVGVGGGIWRESARWDEKYVLGGQLARGIWREYAGCHSRQLHIVGVWPVDCSKTVIGHIVLPDTWRRVAVLPIAGLGGQSTATSTATAVKMR